MKVIDKILLVLLALIVLALCVMACLVAFCWPFGIVEMQNALTYLDETVVKLIICGAALLIAILAVRMFFAISGRKQARPSAALLQQTEIGSSSITYAALNGMVLRHLRAQRGVRDCKTSVSPQNDGVAIYARIAAMPETVLPTLTADLQKSVKEYVETYSGIRVNDVRVLVENAEAAGAPSRVG